MTSKSDASLEELLLQKNIISQEQLKAVLESQKETGASLQTVLLDLGFIEDERALLPLLAQQYGVEFADLKHMDIAQEIVNKVSAKLVHFYTIMPIDYQDDILTIALTDPFNIHILDGIALNAKCKIKTVLASEKDILEAIREYYGVGAETIDRMMDNSIVEKEKPSDEGIDDIASEASISKFVNQILLEAYKDRATDIHVEPYEDELAIRYRVDGILYDAKVPSGIKRFGEAINSRIKIMSNLNIAEKRLPQDGRFKIRIKEVSLDLRVSFLPTPFGESIVIRILNAAKLYSLEDLGFSAPYLKIMDGLINNPYGIIFLTGPTGSGKTTTLYSCLSRVNKTDRKIVTIEDPIEYQIKGITQTQIHPAIGFGFEDGLRYILRHDPDIIMVGEVRDVETAKIAIQVALTGHLIFSTLHTNDAASGITRLLDMGVDAYLISSSVQCFIAQRLVRLICPKCKVPEKITAEIADQFKVKADAIASLKIYKGTGCEACNHTGYFSRQAIYEFLILNDAIREMIMARATASQIKYKAIELGMKTLLENGWESVKNGLTTLSEIARVTQNEEE